MSNEIDTNQSKENLDVQNLLKKLRLYIKGIKSKRMISAKETFNKMKEFVQKVFLALQNCLSKNSERSIEAKKMLS